ncbi:MAG: formyltransferase family protein [Pyrinomonadaceae bacterium]
MKTLLICHEDATLDRDGMARWLASFSELTGVIVLREKGGRKLKRVRREIERVGVLRFLDVTAFRFYYKMFLAKTDASWENEKIEELRRTYADFSAPVLITHSPNSKEAEEFIKTQKPDIMIARCKVILNKRIFSLSAIGTFVMHPGICPEYRNAHGCFWALSRGDFEKVGMTLLKVDAGVDTGKIYGFYSYPFDSKNESHVRIQTRVVLDNLPQLEIKLKEIAGGNAATIDVAGRASGVWGHPWLTRYLAWKRRARRTGK